MQNNMSSIKSKGKRVDTDFSDGTRTKRKSADCGTLKLGVSNLSKAQSVRKTYNVTGVDIKVPVQKTRDIVDWATGEGKIVPNDQRLNMYDHEIMVMKEELKSVKEVVSSLGDKFADFQASFIELQQHIMARNFKGPYASPSNTETWQFPKASNPFICEICIESKAANKSFSIKGCSHAYCMDCIVKYVATKLQENITSIRCPATDCDGFLEPEYCRHILPQDVFDRWGTALCEALIVGAQKFYCPFKDCSAMLIDDGGEAICESECPNCRRMFCAQCRVPWHAGMKCVEFQKLNKDEREREDILLMKVAQKKNWKRCPNCRYYVEKENGCMYMKCRCGTAFCYNCGTPSDKFSDQYHYCNHCKH